MIRIRENMTTEADSEREGLKDAMVLALTMEEET
jgi:hypothetical protein